MFRFIKSIFGGISSFVICKSVKYKSIDCKVRLEIIVNSDEPVFYPFSIKTSKCSSSCNNINDSYAEMCVPEVIKNINV